MDHSATYSPEDNKLRLYPAYRLDADEYARVKAAGFKWAPKQELFVAPMWTPSREDLLLEMCGEIGDEDTSLVDRAEQRAERFDDYSDKRADEAERAHNHVSSIADNIPLGQPILVGHHSEKRARRDAEKIERGMRKAINLWETSKYWEQRAKGALSHAKYKERADVRARRIKGIEADKRKQERSRTDAEKCLAMWTREGLTLEQAILIAGRTNCGSLRLARKAGDREDFEQRPDAYAALSNSYPSLYAPRTLEEVVEAAKYAYPRSIARCDRWINHYENRLAYEKAMLDEQGASDLIKKAARPKQLPLCNYRQESFTFENRYNRGSFETFEQIELTSAEYQAIYADHRGTRIVDNSHRVRIALNPKATGSYFSRPWVVIFLTDSKVHEKPCAITKPEPVATVPRPVTNYKEPERTKFDDMKESLKTGVQVVSAPQLFPTPPEIAARMIEAAEIEAGHRVLEPSAGTGSIVKALPCLRPRGWLTTVEINHDLAKNLEQWADHPICGDFLELSDLGSFDRIVMNPPFENGADVKHIQHALLFLKPGGKLVALCANGPRQNEKLKPMADSWEVLPAGAFSAQGTGVNVAMIVVTAPEEAPKDLLAVEPILVAGSAPVELPPLQLTGGGMLKQVYQQGSFLF